LRQCTTYKQKDIYMKYEWKTHDYWTYNHLVYGYAVRCFSSLVVIENFKPLNYDENKPRCKICEDFAEEIIPMNVHGPNVLHINRKIFI